tara:strand:+ start:96 stop:707 length:612 start_codon:yes stop_codon:yes gene_type:complete
MTEIFICETHHPDGRAEAYQSTVRDLTHYVAEHLDHENELRDIGKLSRQKTLNGKVQDVMRFTMQNLIVEYDFKEFFIRCKERAETYGAFFKALNSHKFLDDPFTVEDDPFSNVYFNDGGKLVETGNEPVIQVTLFDDSRSVAVSELLENDPSSTAFADIELYDDFKSEIGEQIESILEGYETEVSYTSPFYERLDNFDPAGH